MPIEKVNRWSIVALSLGGGALLALLVADVCIWYANQQPALAAPFHTLAVLVIICVILSGVAGLLTAWNARRQERMFGALMVGNRAPELRAVNGLPPENVRAFELGRKVERDTGHTS